MTSAAFVAALKPLLEARSGLVAIGCAVHLTWTPDVTAPAIVLIRSRVSHEVEWTRMGPKRTETGSIPGSVYTTAADVQTAANQATVILDEIAATITPALPSVGAGTWKAELGSIGWMAFPSDKGGYLIDAEYDITYTADLAA